MQTTVARWLIDHDPATTRECFARLRTGTACTCNQCRNFDAAAGRTFPQDFIELCQLLGLDPTKPAELAHYCREASGLYLTAGWFHFVGRILDGRDVLDGEGAYEFEKLPSEFEFGFTSRLSLVPDAFAGHPIVQLEFVTRVPWVLAEAESPAN